MCFQGSILYNFFGINYIKIDVIQGKIQLVEAILNVSYAKISFIVLTPGLGGNLNFGPAVWKPSLLTMPHPLQNRTQGVIWAIPKTDVNVGKVKHNFLGFQQQAANDIEQVLNPSLTSRVLCRIIYELLLNFWVMYAIVP